MATIITVNEESHIVKESKTDIDRVFDVNTKILKVNQRCHITYFEGDMEQDKTTYEPISFIKQNIIKYY